MKNLRSLIFFTGIFLFVHSAVSQCFNMTSLNTTGVKCSIANHEYERLDANSYWYAWKWYDNSKEDYGLTGNNVYRTRQTVVKVQGNDVTNPSLKMIPDGHSTSIRLGNPYTGTYGQSVQIRPQQYASWHPQAEMISYEFTVTADNPIILFEYAGIMDRTSHQFSDKRKDNNPIIVVGITDLNDNVLNESTTYFSHVGDSKLATNPDWKLFTRTINGTSYTNCYWKDWSTTGFDLSSYIGKTVRIQIENYECSFATGTLTSQGYISGFNYCANHFSYLYFYLSCAPKQIDVECLESHQVRLTASEGFTYQWYKQGSPNSIISTQRSIVVTADGHTTYCCRLSQKDGMTGTFVLDTLPPCPIETHLYDTICAGESRIFNHKTLTESGTYEQVVHLSADLDSTIYYHLTVQQAIPAAKEIDDFCEGSTYEWKGHGTRFAALTEGGIYKDTLRYSTGCDSVYSELHLTRQSMVRIVETRYYCPEFFGGESSNGDTWRGEDITSFADSGKQVTSPSLDGCDTLFILDMQKVESVVYHDTIVWENYGFLWPRIGKNVENAWWANFYRNYGYTIPYGACNAHAYLHTIIAKKQTDTIRVCQPDLPIEWRGQTIMGRYDNGKQVVLKNKQGEDSVYVKLHLIVTSIQHTDIDTTLCFGDSLLFDSQWLKSSGMYRCTIPTQDEPHCDSIVSLNLHFSQPTQDYEEQMTMCQGDQWEWQPYDAKSLLIDAVDSTYHDTIRNQNGCDSLRFTLRVTSFKPTYETLYDTICEGDTLTFFGMDLTETTEYQATIRNAHGCDSIVTLHLTVTKRDTTSLYESICLGDTLPFVDTLLTTGGDYYHHFTNLKGCDSLVIMHLSVRQPSQETLYDTICYGSSRFFIDTSLNTTGSYQRHIPNSQGCDSLITLYLTVLPKPDTIDYQQTICYGTVYSDDYFLKLSQSGVHTYNESYRDKACDSVIHRLTLNVLPSRKDSIYHRTICYGSSYSDLLFTNLTVSNTYDTVLPYYQTSCDSIHYRLILNVLPDVIDSTYQRSICAGSAYDDAYFSNLTKDSTYQFTVPFSQQECDSVRYTLSLRVIEPTFAKTDTLRQCANQITMPSWHQYQPLTDYGEYFDTLFSIGGCDSIYYTLHFIKDSVYHQQDVAYINKGEHYFWEGKDYFSDKADTVTDIAIYQTIYGCDSIRELTLYVLDNVTLIYDTICYGDTRSWYTFDHLNDTVCISTGQYTTHLQTSHNTDSVAVLHLTVLEADTIPEQVVYICHGETYSWFDHPYDHLSQTGLYHDTAYYANGCPRRYYTLNLVVLPETVDSVYEQFICAGNSYNDAYFHDLNIEDTYIHTKSFSTNKACDSVRYLLKLKVLSPKTFVDSVQLCAAELPYVWNNLSIESVEDDGKQVTLTSYQGCDSIVTLHLSIGDATRIRVQEVMCEGGFYLFAGDSLFHPGAYEHTFHRAGKCDSIVTLTLSQEAAPVVSVEDTIILGEVYPFDNRLLTDPGEYRDTTYEDQTHCRNITLLTLYVDTPEVIVYQYDTLVICENETPYVWQGHEGFDTLRQTGTYRDSLHPGIIYVLDLTVQRTIQESAQEVIISSLEPYHWIGHPNFTSLSESGKYQDTTYYTTGCDSTYATLDLHVYDPQVIADILIDTACANDTYLTLTLHTIEGKPTRCQILFDEESHTQGFRDTTDIVIEDDSRDYIINLPIPQPEDSLHYPRPDIYQISLQITDIFQHITDTTLSFVLLYPSWVIQQRWNDVLMVQNADYNGGYTFSDIQWYHNGERIHDSRGIHNGYIYGLQHTDAYWAELTRTTDGKTIRTCYVFPEDKGVDNDNTQIKHYLNLVPRERNQRHLQISTNSNASGTYLLYGVDGKIIKTGTYGEMPGTNEIDLPDALPAGTYIFRFTSDCGDIFTIKHLIP